MAVKPTNFYRKYLRIEVQDFDPVAHSRGVRRGFTDSMITALCKLLDKTWDQVVKDIFKLAFEQKRVPADLILQDIHLEKYGYKRYSFREMAHVTCGEFIYTHLNDEFIIGDTHRVSCFKNGILWDTHINNEWVDGFLLREAKYVFIKGRLSDEYVYEPAESR